MNNETNEEQFFNVIRIETSLVFGTKEDKFFMLSQELDVTRNNLSELAASAKEAFPEPLRDRPFCIISRRTTPEETFLNQEHFVPEGLGFGWARLPLGFGTCDRVNHFFSKHELEWLRFGAMGILRPFFVAEGKNDPPEFHSPTKKSRLVTFTHNSHGKFVIEVRSCVPLNIPDEGENGELGINLPASDSNSTSVSLALHKMAYLALYVAQPEMILDPGFNRLIEFLNAPSEHTFMPFREQFIPGSAPGVTLRFYVDMKEMSNENEGDRRIFGLEGLYVTMTVHHMLYFLALVGEFPETELPETAQLREYEEFGHPRKRLTKIAFRFGRVLRLHNTSAL